MAVLLMSIVATSFLVVLLASFSWYNVLWWASLVLACSCSGILAARSKFTKSTRIYPVLDPSKKRFYSFPFFKAPLRYRNKKPVPVGLNPIISELSSLIRRDFVESWYLPLVTYKPEIFLGEVKADMEYVTGELCHLLSSAHYFQFLTEDLPQVLSDHIHQMKLASTANGDLTQPFVLHECARDKAKEEAHLQALSRILCYKLLPPRHDRLTMDLAIDVFTKQVLQPMVNHMTNPDNVNQSLLSYLTRQEELATSYKRTFSYAATYERFVELIQKCDDIVELKQIRYHIITEIMQSTTLQGLKAESDASQQSHNQKTHIKFSMLNSRDLKKYVNQLRVAKTKCEKRIVKIGGDDYAEYFSEEQLPNQLRGQKVISFKLTMHSLACRGCFHAFLKADDSESLLEYWVAAETLKSCDPADRHRLAAEIYNKYIVSSVSLVKLDKMLMKEMESFLIGNRGPEAFYGAQDIVYRQLEKNHYPQFLVSDVYHNFVVNWDGSESSSGETTSFGSNEDYEDDYHEVDEEDVDMQQTTSEYNKKKIADIDERIFNKTQAYQVMSSQRTDVTSNTKYATVLSDLEKELEALKLERRALEAHQEQVESWWKHVGQWTAKVVQHELVKEDGGWIIYYIIMIRLQDQLLASACASDRNGWVVTRTYRQVRELYQDLCQIDEDISQLTIPSKVRLGKPSEEYMKKSEGQITDFLQWVIADKTLSQSAELFNFVSTHPHLNTEHVRKSGLFKVSRLFKRRKQSAAVVRDSADLLFYTQADQGTKERSKDSIARPFYQLISEIFELSSKFLRKTFVQMVQVTYGKSINRQIRETVDWMVSEPMLVYYLKMFRDIFWPDGRLAPASPTRGIEEMQETKAEAKAALTRNIPEVVIRIFGDKTAKRGFSKFFNTLQDHSLNKHLFYVLLSKFLERVFPEILAAKRAQGSPADSYLPSTNQSSYSDPTANEMAGSNDKFTLFSRRRSSLGAETIASQQSVVSESSEGSAQSANQDAAGAKTHPVSADKHVYKRYVTIK